MTIVYDAGCPFCVRCADWLLRQRPAVALQVVPSDDPDVRAVYGHLPGFGTELFVAADSGQVWAGPDAFIAAMWCLARYRGLALELSGPAGHGIARKFFQSVSENRGRLGRALWLDDCEDGQCAR